MKIYKSKKTKIRVRTQSKLLTTKTNIFYTVSDEKVAFIRITMLSKVMEVADFSNTSSAITTEPTISAPTITVIV